MNVSYLASDTSSKCNVREAIEPLSFRNYIDWYKLELVSYICIFFLYFILHFLNLKYNILISIQPQETQVNKLIYESDGFRNVYLTKTVCPLWKLFQHIQLYSKTTLTLFVNMCLHSPSCQVGNWEQWERAMNFSDQLLDIPLIYVLPHFALTAPFCRKSAPSAATNAPLCNNDCPNLL